MRTAPLVYIAGPFTHPDPIENTHHAIHIGLGIHELLDVGVIIPHVTLAAHLVSPRPVDYWYRYDLLQLEACDALYRIEGPSKGADLEVAKARELGIPVAFDFDHLTRLVGEIRARMLAARATRLSAQQ